MERARWTSSILLCALLALPLSAASAAEARQALRHADPQYPPLARQMRLYGDITLEISVAPGGEVTEVHVLSGHPILAVAAAEAVKHWRYAPSAEPTQIEVRVSFKLP